GEGICIDTSIAGGFFLNRGWWIASEGNGSSSPNLLVQINRHGHVTREIQLPATLDLGADASIGGANRWDLRNSTPTLDMGGFTLTKAGANYIGLVAVGVSNPGDIDVTEGTFSIQTGTTMGGTSANTITVRNGAILSSWQAANQVDWSLDLKNGATLQSESAAADTNNTWAGPVTLENSGTVTIDAVGTMTLSGDISGTGSAINKNSGGSVFVSGTNSYTGLTSVNAGALILRNASALGTTAAGTTVANGARVEVDNLTITGEDITVAGNGGNFFGALQARAGTAVWTGDVSVTADQTRIGAQAGASLEVSGVISSTSNHTVVFRPADLTTTVIPSGANTYTGPTSIVGGVVEVSDIGSIAGGPSNFGSSSTVADGTIHMSVNGATGYLRYIGTGETTDRVVNLNATTNGAYLDQSGTGLLKFTSDFTATGAGSKNIALLGSTDGVGEIAGAVVDNSGTNTTRITKEGTGTWVLSGNNTFTGTVTVANGVLRITNSNALGLGTKNVTINASANKWLELDGSGGAITLGSNLSFQSSGINGVVRNIAGDNVIEGTFTMTLGNGNTKIISDNAGSLTLNGDIAANTSGRVLDLSGDSVANNAFNGVLSNASTPSLAKTGTGVWTLNGANLYAGATTVSGGTLVIGATGSIDASASLEVAAGAELDTTAKSSHTLPGTVTIGLDGDTDTSGLIDATGQELVIDAANVTFSVTGTLDAPVYVLANYDSISGTAEFASVTPPSGYTLDYAYNSGTQIALVKTAGSAYDTWVDTYFPGETDPAIIGKDADPDGDGANNLLEFALNGNPDDGSNNGLYASLVQDASAPA
ncbi:MAG: autotransporter-associated beta strand repeat-containing protein, partial [Verrucomicrobiae bacterium]|nr:autotransporter-associated beta strand repeat-containing protein [Verrucomicrobiae bacterium]